MTQQLSLWDEPPQYYQLTDIIVSWTCWADGDTSPEELERLAELMLGEIAFLKSTSGHEYVWQCISTGVVGDRVLMAYEYLCTPREFWLHLPHTPAQELIAHPELYGQEPAAAADDEDEDL